MPRFARLSGEFEIATGARADEVTWRFERTTDIDREFTFADDPGRSRPQARVMLPVMLGALRSWDGVLDGAGRPVPYSEQAFYEYVPPPLRLELLDRWTHRMRGTTPDETAEEAPSTKASAPDERDGRSEPGEADSAPGPALQQTVEESRTEAEPAEPPEALTPSPLPMGEGPTTMTLARASGERDADDWPPVAAPAAPNAPVTEIAVDRRRESGSPESVEARGPGQPPTGFADWLAGADVPSELLPGQAPDGEPSSAGEFPPPRTPDVTNEPDVGAPLATDEPARPVEAAVADRSARAVATGEAPLPYSAEPALAAGEGLDAPEVPVGAAQLMAEPFVESDAAPTAPIREPSPSVEPTTDVRAPEPRANEPSATPERRRSDLEPEDAPSGLTSALDDPDLDMDWRLEDAVESLYRRNRRAELSEPLF